MNGLTRDRTAESASRDQISGANGDRENIIFTVQLTTSRTVTADTHFAVCVHTCIHAYIHTNNGLVCVCSCFKNENKNAQRVENH